MSAVIRVGHKGADLIVPGNTLASFDAAISAGVDMIEFDVLPVSGRLVLAHDYEDAGRRTPASIEEGLAHLAPTAVDLLVDMKLPGYELRVVDALVEQGLLGRALICTQYIESLDVIRTAGVEARLGWTVPKLRRDPFRSAFTRLPAYGALLAYRATMPARAARAIGAGRVDTITAHWRLVTPALVAAVQRAGGELYVWTVDDLPRLRALEALGVDGLITNDPRLFSPPAP
jgi:glycerophosphoryl diester phosphodiesterase